MAEQRSFKVDMRVEPSRRPRERVADQLVETLRVAGVERVFGIPGGAISPLYDALIDSGIEVVVAQHEGMAMYMAYGHARATGTPGVVMVTSGPGVLNTATGLAAARLDEVPLVLVSGDVKGEQSGRGVLQDGGVHGLDILGVVRPLVKHAASVPHGGRAVAALQQAIDLSLVHPRGPVVLNLSMDAAGTATPPSRFRLGLGALRPAEDDVCARVAEGLATATRPVLWLGLGARLAGLGPDIFRIAERARCPVITDVEAKGLFPESHALSLGMFGVGSRGLAERYLADGTDLLITLGARLDDTTTSGFSDLLRAETMIQLDHDPERLNRSYDFDLGVVCDLLETVRRIERLTSPPSPHLFLARDGALREARRSVVTPAVPELTRAPHHPVATIRALQRLLPKDTVFTSDIGNHLLFAAQNLQLDKPDSFHVSNGLGGMGSGVGTAIGLALALRGQRTVVGICGDGSFRMVGNELATCAAHRIPVVLAVLDDGQLGMVEHGNGRVFGRSGFCESPPVDVVGYARALGADGVRIESARDLERAVSRIGGGPLVLHFPTRADVRAANPRADVFAFPDSK